MVIGWNILSYWTGIHWIGIAALIIGFAGIISEKFAQKVVNLIHQTFSYIFDFIQKVILTIIFIFVITPIAFLRRREKISKKSSWIKMASKSPEQLRKMW